MILDDSEVIELVRILPDKDAEGALAFLERHFKGRARDLLEGGSKVMLKVPEASIQQARDDLFRK